MSLENEVKKLSEAINANTSAIKDFMLQSPASNLSAKSDAQPTQPDPVQPEAPAAPAAPVPAAPAPAPAPAAPVPAAPAPAAPSTASLSPDEKVKIMAELENIAVTKAEKMGDGGEATFALIRKYAGANAATFNKVPDDKLQAIKAEIEAL